MGCFKICFGTCNNQKVPSKDKRLARFDPLQPTKPVVQVSKSVVFEFKNKNDVLVGRDNKEKESEIYNLGNRKCTILGDKKDENVVGVDKFLDYSISKLEDKSYESLKIARIGDLLEESADKKVNGLCNVRQVLQEESLDSPDFLTTGHVNGVHDVNQLVQEESSDSLFSVSVGSKKKANAADNDDDVVPEESSDSLFSVSVESRKQHSGLDNVDQLVQDESSDSLFSVSVGSKKKVNVAENGDDQEESSNSLFSVSVGSRKQLNSLDNVDQLVQEESTDSLFSVSVGSEKKANAAEKLDQLVQEESFDSLFSVSLESKQVNAAETDENEVNSPITLGSKHICENPYSRANSVLGPIENVTKRKKEIKVTTDYTCIESKEDEKENMSSVQGLNLIPFSEEEPSLKKLNSTISKQKRGSHSKAGASPIAVDTSLSSWLVKSDGGSSVDSPISAAFSCEELKQHSFKLVSQTNIFNHHSTSSSKRLESAGTKEWL